MKRVHIFSLVMLMVLAVGIDHAWTKEESIRKGSKVTLDFILKVEEQIVDTSKGKSPLQYVHGTGMILPGLEKSLEGLKAGDEIEASISPEDGYGPVDPKAIVELPDEHMARSSRPKVGQVLSLNGSNGQTFRGIITEVRRNTLTIDFNHPLAGKTLDYAIRIISVD